DRDQEAERHGRERDPVNVTPTAGEGEQHGRKRDDDREHEQIRRRHRAQQRSRIGHQASLGSVLMAASRSARNVAEPATWNSRSNSATASAVAEKATTTPVMTRACGTGSAPKPAAAPRRATTPNSRNTLLPSTLKARILRSGCGCVTTP